MSILGESYAGLGIRKNEPISGQIPANIRRYRGLIRGVSFLKTWENSRPKPGTLDVSKTGKLYAIKWGYYILASEISP